MNNNNFPSEEFERDLDVSVSKHYEEPNEEKIIDSINQFLDNILGLNQNDPLAYDLCSLLLEIQRCVSSNYSFYPFNMIEKMNSIKRRIDWKTSTEENILKKLKSAGVTIE